MLIAAGKHGADGNNAMPLLVTVTGFYASGKRLPSASIGEDVKQTDHSA